MTGKICKVTFADGRSKEIRCEDWEIDDDGDVVIHPLDQDKDRIYFNSRFWVSVETV